MMWITEKCRSESGRDWHVVRLDLSFYPSFWSRFTGFDHSLTICDKFVELKSKYQGRLGGFFSDGGLRCVDRYESLRLSDDGPDVREWLRTNLTGRAHLRIRREHHYDLQFGGGFDYKDFKVFFHKSADAIKFKLCLM